MFTGWFPQPVNITSDLDCRAQYLFTGLYFREYMNATLTHFEDETGLTTIGEYAFAGMPYLQSVSMPTLTTIPDSCFRDCAALEEVNLPAALATNAHAFTYNYAMKKLFLPEVVLLNEAPLVYYTTALKELRLPKNTSSLTNMLGSNAMLEVIDIGLATTIGVYLSGTVYGDMKYFIARNTSQVVTPSVSSGRIFSNSSPIAQGTGKILVPRSMVDAYKEDSRWSRYADVIVAIEDYPDICG